MRKETKKYKIACFVGLVIVLILLLICLGISMFDKANEGTNDTRANAQSSSHEKAKTNNGTTRVGRVPREENSDEGTEVSRNASSSKESEVESDYDAPRLPVVDMDARYIDKTDLGPHEGDVKTIDSGKFKGGTCYYWHAKNGTDDVVFSAVVKDGVVVKVNKFNTNTNYWNDGSLLGRDFPDLYVSGADVKDSNSTVLEDPLDYSSPEEYADNAEDYFKEQGSKNPWYEAYKYWEDNADSY